MEVGAPTGPPIVGLSLDGPAPQRRVTVAFRLILAVPHLFWLYILAIAGEFAVVAAWFAAVFTGRMPAGIHEFVGKWLRYHTRVMAYLYLLTDEYPPFSFDADGYAVELEVPPPGRLNRAAVLFRLILLVPASLLAGLVGFGAMIAMVLIWLIVLIAGRTPRSLFEALAAILRYQLRLFAFGALLTSEYPKALFGDKGLAPDATPVAEAPMPSLEPEVPAPFAPPPPIDVLTTPPRITRLVLSKAAKRIVALFIVVGVLTYGGFFTIAIVNGVRNRETLSKVDRYDDELVVASNTFGREAQSCALGGGASCIHAAVRHMAEAVDRFRTEFGTLHFPAGALVAANRVDDDASTMASLLRQLATIDDPARYQSTLARYQAAVADFNSDIADLRVALVGTGA